MTPPKSAEARLARERAALGRAVAVKFRIGFGFDLHRLAPASCLILGGVEIPHSHGLDGHSDAAGAFIGPDTLPRAQTKGLDARAMLHAHDSGRFFEALGDRVVPGPTFTNVNDFRAVLIL